MTTVLLAIEDGVAEIRLNRPERLNALDIDLAQAFLDAVRRATEAPQVRAVLISGEGRAFCVGGDLALLQSSDDRRECARAIIAPINAGLETLQASGVPSIAALQGPVAGGGMSLALGTDLAIAADDVRMSFAYLEIAASPDCGGSWALPRLVGLRKALEIALLASNLTAMEALQLGLVNRVQPRQDMRDHARSLARRLALAPAQAVARTLKLLRSSLYETLPAQLDAELQAFAEGAGEADFTEGLEAFFDKRAPRFQGRKTPRL